MNFKRYLGSVGYRLGAMGLAGMALAALPMTAASGRPTLGLAVGGVLALLATLSALEARVMRQRAER